MKNLKLNEMAQNKLSNKEMQNVKGAEKLCHCGCNGPSSTNANGWANAAGGLSSPGGGEVFIILDEIIITVATSDNP